MSRLIPSCLAWILALMPALGEAEPTTSSRREPLVYDTPLQLHDFDPGIRVEGPSRDAPLIRAREGETPSDWNPITPGVVNMDIREELIRESIFRNMSAGLSPVAAPPPPQASDDRDRSRNRILPTLDDDATGSSSDAAPRQDSSGWGWLADEVEHRQRMRSVEASARADESAPRPDSSETAAPQFGWAASPDREPDYREAGSAVVVSTGLNDVDDGGWYGAAPVTDLPWGAGAMDVGGTEWGGSRWRDDSSSAGLGAGSLAPDFGSWRERVGTPSREAGPSAGGSFTREAWGSDSGSASMGGSARSTIEPWGGDRVGGLSPVGGGASVGSGWTADWSSDTGWRSGGYASPAAPAPVSSSASTPRSPSLTTPSATPGISINSSGWLAEPRR